MNVARMVLLAIATAVSLAAIAWALADKLGSDAPYVWGSFGLWIGLRVGVFTGTPRERSRDSGRLS